MTVKDLHRKAMEYNDQAIIANHNYRSAKSHYKKAFEYEKKAFKLFSSQSNVEPTRSVLLRSAASLAMMAELHLEAEKMIALAIAGNPPAEILKELSILNFENSQKLHSKKFDDNKQAGFSEYIASKLHEYTKENKLSLAQMAKKLAIDEPTLKNWLGGQEDFSLSALRQIDEKIGIDFLSSWSINRIQNEILVFNPSFFNMETNYLLDMKINPILDYNDNGPVVFLSHHLPSYDPITGIYTSVDQSQSKKNVSLVGAELARRRLKYPVAGIVPQAIGIAAPDLRIDHSNTFYYVIAVNAWLEKQLEKEKNYK